MAKRTKDTSKYSEAIRRRWADPAARDKLVQSLRGKQRGAAVPEIASQVAKRRVQKWKRDPAQRAAFLDRQRAANAARWVGHEKRYGHCACGEPITERQRMTCGKPACISARKATSGRNRKGERRPSPSPETKERMAAASREHWQSPVYRSKVMSRSVEAMKSAAVRQKKSVASKRAWADPVKAEAWAAKVVRNSHYGRYPFTCRTGRAFVFKSGDEWERGFARWLDAQGLTWDYEPKVLHLSTGRRYIPDFWIEERQTFVELKASHRDVLKAEQAQSEGWPVVVLQGPAAIRAFQAAQ